jgi:hypothetical protein
MSLHGFLYGDIPTAAAINAAEAIGEAHRARTATEALDTRLDRMVLAFEALWSLTRDRLQITDEELVARMNDLDLSDGRLDGKVRKGAVSCPKCGRTISRRLPKCIYCSQPIVHDPFA